jgi:hypothetical protein
VTFHGASRRIPPVSTHRHPLESTYQIPRPRAQPQTPFHKTLSAKHKATGVFLKLFPLLARDSTLSPHNKLTLHKLTIRPTLTHSRRPRLEQHIVFQLSSSSTSTIQMPYESLVITPDVPPSHTYTPFSTSNPLRSLFTV